MIDFQGHQNKRIVYIKLTELTCGAVCVYPARVKDAYDVFFKLKMNSTIPIAAVATGLKFKIYF